MSVMGNANPSVLGEGASEEKGEHARLQSFVGAMAIADLVKSTLGPKGMDKILQSVSKGNAVTVTNDGATILKSIYVDNPAAKVLVDISKAHGDEEAQIGGSGRRGVGCAWWCLPLGHLRCSRAAGEARALAELGALRRRAISLGARVTASEPPTRLPTTFGSSIRVCVLVELLEKIEMMEKIELLETQVLEDGLVRCRFKDGWVSAQTRSGERMYGHRQPRHLVRTCYLLAM